MTAQAPSVLADRYELGPLLGSGGMAQVHRARDLLLDRPVAVKVFRLDVAGSELARIEQETRTLARLSHPGLVAVYDAGGFVQGSDAPRPYLVMELVEGPTWEQCCVDGSLTADEVAARGAELCDTLAHVHGQGVVHRDVKPANVLMAAGGRPKLADFGIALLVDAARHTATGLTIGTAAYLSPEQVLGEPVGPPSDVWSLGLVLLEALTGRREYAGSTTETALARLSRPPQVPDDAPPGLRTALTAMLAAAPADRPTAAEAAQLLRAAPTPTRVLTTAVPRPRPTRSEPGVVREVLRERAGSRWVWAAAGVLAVLVLAAVLLLTGDGDAGGSGTVPASGSAPSPAPSTPLERDLAELREAVTP